MDEKLKEKLHKILEETPSENPWLDYKEFPYENDRIAKFVKLLDGFLNSIDGYGKDKFIIIGIDDNGNKKGLIPALPMQDDKVYQDMADKISPRPSIQTGKIKYTENGIEYEFGYIYIPADKNDDRVYTINTDIPDESVYVNDIRNGAKTKPRVYASTAWIRCGSVLRPLNEERRRKIYEETNRPSKVNYASIASNYYDLSKTELNNNILKFAVLVGGWNENNEADKNLLSELIGLPYQTWITSLRLMLKEEGSPLTYKGEKWIVEDRLSLLKSFASAYFKDEVLQYQAKVIEVLSEINPRFDLLPEQRIMSQYYSKNLKYSDLLRMSLSEGLAMISSIKDEFTNAGDSINNYSWNVVSQTLNTKDWKVWASLEKQLPLLAESQPNAFLIRLDEMLSDCEAIKLLMTSSETWITNNYYTAGLYWALQVIAWEGKYLVRVCMTLLQLAEYDKKAIEQIAGILLPWYPQTNASIEIRKTAIENIISENEELGWELLLELMPNKKTIGSPSEKPKWNNLVDENKEVLTKDYWKQVENYLGILIKCSKTNVNRICDLIDLLDDVPKKFFDKIITKLSERKLKKLAEEKKYDLWNHLEDFITRHTKYSDSEWALSSNVLNIVKNISDELKPESLLLTGKRYFRKDNWLLFDEKGDYRESEKKLHSVRVETIKGIYCLGLELTVKFVEEVDDSYVVGICLSEIIDDVNLETRILNYLDSTNLNLCTFAQGFVYKKHMTYGYEWLDNFKISDWILNKKINLLTVLPDTKATWELVSQFLGSNQDEYWKVVNIRFIDESSDINYPLKKLLDCKRPSRALDLISHKLYDKNNNDYDRNLAVAALEGLLSKQDELNNLDTYHIKEIIKDLQKSDVEKARLYQIEWAYLTLLDDKDCRPITIEKELSENPEIYNDILSLAYKEHSKTKEEAKVVDEKIATNAYRLLHLWKYPPGLEENNTINKKKLNDWYKKMIEVCKESDRLEVGLLNFGHVLFYSPPDKSGLWIDKSVAEILNEKDASTIRDGYRTESFNSRGVISIDSEGKVFDDIAAGYTLKADEIEKAKYHRLAMIMRDLSESYKEQAERTRKRYSDDD